MSAHLVKYGTAVDLWTILLTAGSRDGQSNPTLATGDVKISKDGGAFANMATLPSVSPASDVQVKVPLSATEAQAKRMMIRFKDAAGAEWEEQTILVETYGHASAAHYDQGDIKFTGVLVDNASGSGHAVELKASTTGAALRLTGAATGSASRGLDVNTQAAEGVFVAASGGNAAGVHIEGDGTGDGVYIEGGGVSGHGLAVYGSPCGDGDGIHVEGGGDSGHGISSAATGATTGPNHGIKTVGSLNGSGFRVEGHGTGDGMKVVGGASGNGLDTVGGATSGDGFHTEGTGTGYNGIRSLGSTGGGDGINATAQTNGSGIYAEGDNGGDGLRLRGDGAGAGLGAIGGATGDGINGTGGSTSGDGIRGEGNGDGAGLYAKGSSANGNGIRAQGFQKGAGMLLIGGADGMDFDQDDLPVSLPAGFVERSSLISENITRTGYPDMGVIFTDSTAPDVEDFDGPSLIGAVIYSTDEEIVNGARSDRRFIVMGGYFYDDVTNTTKKVFGAALDPDLFGCTEGGSVTVDTNWTGTDLDEDTHGDGWTFIVAKSDKTYPGSADNLAIYRLPGMYRTDTGAASSLTQQEVRDSMKLAPTGGAPAAGSVDTHLDDLLTGQTTIEGKIDTIDGVVDGIDTQLDTVEGKIDTIDTVVDANNVLLTTIDGKVDVIDTNVDALGVLLAVVDGKVDVIDNNVDAIVAKLPAGTISDFDLDDTIDGVPVRDILELELARVNGRYKLNEPGPGKITFYKRDNLTVLFVIQVTDTERTRV